MAEEYNERDGIENRINQNLISRREMLRKGIAVSVAASALTIADVVEALGATANHENSRRDGDKDNPNKNHHIAPHCQVNLDCGPGGNCQTCRDSLVEAGLKDGEAVMAFVKNLLQIGKALSGTNLVTILQGLVEILNGEKGGDLTSGAINTYAQQAVDKYCRTGGGNEKQQRRFIVAQFLYQLLEGAGHVEFQDCKSMAYDFLYGNPEQGC